MLLPVVLLMACVRGHAPEPATVSISLQEDKDGFEEILREEVLRHAEARTVELTVGFALPRKRPDKVAPGSSYDGLLDFLSMADLALGDALYLPDRGEGTALSILQHHGLVRLHGETASLGTAGDTWEIISPSEKLRAQLLERGDARVLELCSIRPVLTSMGRLIPDGADAVVVEYVVTEQVEPTPALNWFKGSRFTGDCLAEPRSWEHETTLVRGNDGRWTLLGQ